MTDFPVRRNTVLLAGAMAMLSVTAQLNAAMSSITFGLVTGVSSLLGLGPALTMISAAVAAFPAGRLMDTHGRIPVLAGGFLAGACGTALMSAGTWLESAWIALPGFVLLLRRPGVIPAIFAGVVSSAVMAAVMNLTGYLVVQHHHHAQHLVFPIIGAHVLGMYLLMPAVGWLVDRIGRPLALAGGLSLLAASTAGLAWLDSVGPIAFLLFGLGLGWNVSFVAATTQLADLAAPGERGRLLGFNDLLAAVGGATLVLVGGFILDNFGVGAFALVAAAVALAPIAFIISPAGSLSPRRP